MTAQSRTYRQWTRLTAVYLLVPLVLLLCGGDSGWWRAWLYSLMFLAAGIGGRAWAETRHPGLTAEWQSADTFRNAKPWDRVLAPLMAISISFPMVIVAGLDHRLGWSPEFPPWLTAIGFILILSGYAFGPWALAENRYFSSVVRIQMDRGHGVCDSGPYRFMRHPGYAGNTLALFGIVLALGSAWTLLPAMVATVLTNAVHRPQHQHRRNGRQRHPGDGQQ